MASCSEGGSGSGGGRGGTHLLGEVDSLLTQTAVLPPRLGTTTTVLIRLLLQRLTRLDTTDRTGSDRTDRGQTDTDRHADRQTDRQTDRHRQGADDCSHPTPAAASHSPGHDRQDRVRQTDTGKTDRTGGRRVGQGGRRTGHKQAGQGTDGLDR